MKQFAAPGIDSDITDYGVYNSGAGSRPEVVSSKVAPNDWQSNNPVWDNGVTSRLVGTSPETQAPNISSIRVRKRGESPWGGFFPSGLKGKARYGDDGAAGSKQNVGGSADHNAGADSRIAGGPGAASSFVRTHGSKSIDRGMKLPILPAKAVRGGAVSIPGGGFHGGIAAPLVPQLPGLASIVKIVQRSEKA